MKEYRAGIYLRLSKEDREVNNSIDMQREITTKYANEHNYIVVEEYVDNGYSGILDSRPALNKMMVDITRHKINMVIVKDMSRLTRNKNLTSYFTDIFFPDNDVRIISVTEYVDSGERYEIDDAVAIRGIVNQSYLEDISRKIKAVKTNFRLNGEFIEGSVVYGYKKEPQYKRKIIVDNNVKNIVQRIFSSYLNDGSSKKIAEELNNEKVLTPSQYLNLKNQGKYWTKAIIDRILSNPIYSGRMILNKYDTNLTLKKRIVERKCNYKYIENTHEAIVSVEDYEKVQDKKGRRRKEQFKSYVYLLKGLVYCKNCGRKLIYKNSSPVRIDKNGKVTGKKNNKGYFLCEEHYLYPNVCDNSDKIMENELNEIVLKTVSKRLKELQMTKYSKEVALLHSKSDPKLNELKKLKKELEKEDNKFKVLYMKKVEGVISQEEFIAQNDIHNEKIKYLQKEIDRLENKDKIKDVPNTIKKWIVAFEGCENFDNNILKNLVEKIEVGKNQEIKITLKV